MARPAVKKQDIEDGAIRLFATNGLAGTTIKDIANEAGVTEGALYRHYKGKNEMAWELYSREAKVFVGGFKAILDNEAIPFAQRIHDVIVFIYEYYQNHPDRLIFVLLTRQSFPDQSKDEADENFNRDIMLAGYIERAMEKGEIQADDPLLKMSMVRGMIIEPVMMHRYGTIDTWPMKYAEQIAHASLKVLGSTEVNF